MNENPWKCRRCGAEKVVPSLARECEKKHEQEDSEVEQASD